MNLKKIFEKKRYVFLTSFLVTYALAWLFFFGLANYYSSRSLKIAGSNIDENLTIEEKVIYEGNDVIVKQVDFNKKSFYEDELTLEITNNSDTKYYVEESYIAVNGVMSASHSLTSKEVLPNTTVLMYIPISLDESNMVGISEIGEVVFDLGFYTDQGGIGVSPTVGFMIEDINIQTNRYKDIPQLEDITGKLIYNQDNIIVTVDEESLFENNMAKISVQNNNDEDIIFTTVKFVVDGNEIDGFLDVKVRANSRTVTSGIQLSYAEDIATNNLSVESVAGVYNEEGTTLFSQPYNVVWK